MRLHSFFNSEVVTATPVETIEQVARKMDQANIGAVVVTDEERPIGIVTDRDLAMALGVSGWHRADPIAAIMSGPVITLNEHDGIFAASQKILESAARRMPIVDDSGRLVGILSADDLLVLLGRELNNVTSGIRRELAAGEGHGGAA